MTPAILTAKKHNIPHHLHEYEHNSNCESYGEEAVQSLGVKAESVFKTLVIKVDDELVVAVIPVRNKLSMKLIAKAHQGKKATMALKAEVERATGYVLGGVSPIGQKKRLPTFIDLSAKQLSQVFVSAGKRGLEIELCPQELLKLTNAKMMPICQ